MLRYLTYLAIYIPVQLFAYLITPLIACFWEMREGWCDNRSYISEAPRLKRWLWWADTPDNSLMGDQSWRASGHDGAKWIDRCLWLYRNSLYGFKWSVLATPAADVSVIRDGPMDLNHHTGRYGVLRIRRADGYWQYKCVKPFMGRILVLNMGWLLDDLSQEKALFMCSPRLK